MLTKNEAQVALVRDHVADRHAGRTWAGCPVCSAWAGGELARRIRAAQDRLVAR
jgi:hypothetical protein